MSKLNKEEKVCRLCKRVKPIKEFIKESSGKELSNCKPCRRRLAEHQAKWRKGNEEVNRERSRRLRDERKDQYNAAKRKIKRNRKEVAAKKNLERTLATIPEDEMFIPVFSYEDKLLVSDRGRFIELKTGTIKGSFETSRGYFAINCTNNVHYRIHKAVWESFNGKVPKGKEIDHIDGDKKNNKLENLRCVTHLENMRGYRTPEFRGGSWYRGVRCDEENGCWVASLCYGGKVHYEESFEDEEGAAEAWNEQALKHGYFLEALNDIKEEN